MDARLHKWLGWSLTSLAVVALYGAVMRYKIAFNLPFFDQGNLLHAHGHFAFSGWISQVLYAGLAAVILPFIAVKKQRKYVGLLALNMLTAIGMLVAFTIYGYNAVSITFSTISILVAIAYLLFFVADGNAIPASHPSKIWALGGLSLNVVSAAGPLMLGYMMATKQVDANFYLGSVYYYLHFQYNGWFFFGSMALALNYVPVNMPALKKYFYLFLFTTVTTVFLSLLWAKLPQWLYFMASFSAFLQLLSWLALAFGCIKLLRDTRSQPRWVPYFFYISAVALTLKFILQAISVIPSLSQLVFGFRPIVIAYLHLVLLGVYTLFLLGFLFNRFIIVPTERAKLMAFIFLSGVLFNELLLATQGFAAFAYIAVPFINEMLLGAAILLLTGAIGLVLVRLLQKNKRVV